MSKVVVSIFYSCIVVRELSTTQQYAAHTTQCLCSCEHRDVDQFRHDQSAPQLVRKAPRFPGYHVNSTAASAATLRRNGARTWTTR